MPWKVPEIESGMRIEAATRSDGGDRIAERHARRQIEGQRDRRELALVVDRQVAGMPGVVAREGRQRHLLPGDAVT